MDNDLDKLANRLRVLYLKLEANGKISGEYQRARALEDRLGSGQHFPGDRDDAEALLAKHGL